MGEIALILLPLLFAAFVLAFAFRRLRRTHTEIGTAPILFDAFGLPRRQNWQVRRAVSRGRAVENPDLATLAVERADYLVRASERNLAMLRRLRWFYVVIELGLLISLALLVVSQFIGDHSNPNAFSLLPQVLILVVLPLLPALNRRALRRAQAAGEANRALAAEHPDAHWEGARRDPHRTRRRLAAVLSLGAVIVTTPLFYGSLRLQDDEISWPLAALFGVAMGAMVLVLIFAAPLKSASANE